MDAIIRISAITALLLSSLLLMKASKNWRWSLCMGLLFLSLSAFVMNNGVTDILRPTGVLSDIAQILTKFMVGFLWLFLIATFEEDFRFRPVYLAVTIFWCGLGLMGLPGLEWGVFSRLLSYGTIIIAFSFILHALWRMKNGFSGDLRTVRREARLWVGVVLSSAIIIDLMVDIGLGFDWHAPAYIIGQNLTAGLMASALVLHVWQADLSNFMGPDKVLKTQLSPREPVASLVMTTMQTQQLFLQPDLRFVDFANMINLNQSQLRKIINHELGFGHFTSFVNHFRIEHAKSLLKDPNRQSDKIISIALDSGFASLPSFQRAFKSIVGKTPTQWKLGKSDQEG